jgi:hypothetical protein
MRLAGALFALLVSLSPLSARADQTDVDDAVRTMDDIRLAQHERSARRLRELVTSDALARDLILLPSQRGPWPDGPIVSYSDHARSVQIDYYAGCQRGSRLRPCLFRLAMSFVRVDGRMLLHEITLHPTR